MPEGVQCTLSGKAQMPVLYATNMLYFPKPDLGYIYLVLVVWCMFQYIHCALTTHNSIIVWLVCFDSGFQLWCSEYVLVWS